MFKKLVIIFSSTFAISLFANNCLAQIKLQKLDKIEPSTTQKAEPPVPQKESEPTRQLQWWERGAVTKDQPQKEMIGVTGREKVDEVEEAKKTYRAFHKNPTVGGQKKYNEAVKILERAGVDPSRIGEIDKTKTAGDLIKHLTDQEQEAFKKTLPEGVEILGKNEDAYFSKNIGDESKPKFVIGDTLEELEKNEKAEIAKATKKEATKKEAIITGAAIGGASALLIGAGVTAAMIGQEQPPTSEDEEDDEQFVLNEDEEELLVGQELEVDEVEEIPPTAEPFELEIDEEEGEIPEIGEEE